MRRLFVLSSVPLALGLIVWAAQPALAPAPASPAPASVTRARLQPATPSCKPEAPIAVSLEVPDDSATGVVRAAFSLRPVLELADLQWRWELSQDVRLVEGDGQGAAAPQRGAVTAGEVGLQLPNDGRHHTARLVATGLLRGGDPAEPELVTVVRTLTWGQPEAATIVVLSPDADSGALAEVAVVPTTHSPGRPSAVRR